MTVGFAILVHESLDRAAQVARHFHDNGKPVVIHVDRRVAAPPFLLGDVINLAAF